MSNVNLLNVGTVIIYDENGNVSDRFELAQSCVTRASGSKQLTLELRRPKPKREVKFKGECRTAGCVYNIGGRECGCRDVKPDCVSFT